MKEDNKKVVIIGAGPAGITCAYRLANYGVSTIIIEKDTAPCGLCKTFLYKGFRFDIGPHRFLSKSKFIEKIWESTLKEEITIVSRFTRIYYENKFFLYPIKPFDVSKKIGVVKSISILIDYVWSNLLYRNRKDDNFEDWMVKRFGRILYTMFFKSYSKKIWGVPGYEIFSEWAVQRIKDLSLISVLKSQIFANKGRIKSLAERFYYPKYGSGQMYNQLLNSALRNGSEINLSSEPVEIELTNNRVWSISFRNRDGKIKRIFIDYLVSSMPFFEIFELFRPIAPKHVIETARRLRYRSLVEVCLIVKGECNCKDQWIYLQEPTIKAARLQLYTNWSNHMGSEDKTIKNIGLEYFCFIQDSIWSMKDNEIINLAMSELFKIGIVKNPQFIDGFTVKIPYAYPMYTGSYKQDLQILKEFIDKIENLQVIGRCGMHRYNNMDHSMLTGIYAAQNILKGRKDYNLWEIGDEKEYVEEDRL